MPCHDATVSYELSDISLDENSALQKSANWVVLFTNKPDLIVAIPDLHGIVIPSCIKHIGAEIILKAISLQSCHQGPIVLLNLISVGPAAVHHNVGAERLCICQVHVIFSGGGCVLLVFKGDEEAHGVILFRKGVGFGLGGLHLHCYWNCHLDFDFSFVVALNVAEETPESCRTHRSGVHTYSGRREAKLFILSFYSNRVKLFGNATLIPMYI